MVSPSSAPQHSVFCHTSDKQNKRQQEAFSSPTHPPLFLKHGKYLLRPSKRDPSCHQGCRWKGSPAALASMQQFQDMAWAQASCHHHPNTQQKQDRMQLTWQDPPQEGSAQLSCRADPRGAGPMAQHPGLDHWCCPTLSIGQ